MVMFYVAMRFKKRPVYGLKMKHSYYKGVYDEKTNLCR